MKKFINVVMVSLAVLVLAACGEETPKEVGNGTNKDVSSNTYFKEAVENEAAQQELYGELLHHGKVAVNPVIQGIDVSSTIGGVNFINRGTKANPGTIVGLACETRAGVWVMSHNIYDDRGNETSKATDFSIMNYRPGVTDIRESDEYSGAYFSTANGDSDINKALRGLVKLNPESTIAFTVEQQDVEGYSRTIAWSPLFKVKDVLKGLKEVNLKKCKNTEPGADGVVQFISTDSLMEEAGKMKQM